MSELPPSLLGGNSLPDTGSTGEGYRMAVAIDHTITRLCPALVPLVVFEIERAKSMQGVSLRNERLTAYQCVADEINLSIVSLDCTFWLIVGFRRDYNLTIIST